MAARLPYRFRLRRHDANNSFGSSGLASAVLQYLPKKLGQLTMWIYWTTRFFHHWIFFLPWWHRHVPRLQWRDSLGLKCERGVQRMRHHFHTWVCHHGAQTLIPLISLWRRQWSYSPIIRKKIMVKYSRSSGWNCVLSLHKFNTVMPRWTLPSVPKRSNNFSVGESTETVVACLKSHKNEFLAEAV